ncbi:hypothetical protein KKF92_01580 [Patescibacteria group bacterium]|nr:hypothetical protein [Patescibacteria group bacterium]
MTKEGVSTSELEGICQSIIGLMDSDRGVSYLSQILHDILCQIDSHPGSLETKRKVLELMAKKIQVRIGDILREIDFLIVEESQKKGDDMYLLAKLNVLATQLNGIYGAINIRLHK